MAKDKRVPAEARIIGANLRYLRVAAGLSQEKLGAVLGVSYQQIQKYEQGSNRFPVEKLYRLRRYYDVPYDVFFRGFDDAGAAAGPDGGLGEEGGDAFVRLSLLRDRSLRRKIERVLLVLLD